MVEGTIQSGQIVQILGVPARSLSHWVSKGLVKPGHYQAVRSHSGGRAHIYTFVNLVEFGLICELRRLGFHIPVVRKLLERAYETGRADRWFGTLSTEHQWLVVDKTNEWTVVTGNILSLPENQTTLTVINLSLTKQRLKEQASPFFATNQATLGVAQ